MTDLAQLRALLLDRPAAYEDYPFGPETLVLKVASKMFALLSLDTSSLRISLKCDPLKADHLRDAYAAITLPSYLDKRHWIAITLDGSVPDALLATLIDESYALVVKGLPKAVRAGLGQNAERRTQDPEG
ncbi:MmcQ/YjbR family DNA-binding protein [Candidatus Gracilibacteria bacterium]|nr:MmcQ/YjbR family DNA-binding protein [Candidatus Gracilibacteria bacterium]